MRTNLLLLDSYHDIENLIHFAFYFSNRYPGMLKIIYVFDFDWMRQSYIVGAPGSSDVSLLAIEQNVHKQFLAASQKMNQIASQYAVKYPNVDYQVNASEVNRVDLVNQEYKNQKDLLLLVSSAESYVEETGGLIQYPNIIDHLKCPVLIIPENLQRFDVSKVLYASNYNRNDIPAIQHLLHILTSPDAPEIVIMHNDEKDSFHGNLTWLGFKSLVQDEFPSQKIEFIHEQNKSFLKAAEKYVQNNEVDILVVMKEKKGLFKQMFSSSDTRKVLAKLDKMILVYHES